MNTPLAERMRPKTLEQYVNQKHLVGDNAPIKVMLDNGLLASMILWGPPGTGKTTLAQLLAELSGREFYTLSAINAGVKEVREVIEQAKKKTLFSSEKNPILFIDEVHRFNKSQQDSLLGAVEKGYITLIGATTENPSFEVVPALLSRCQVYTLKALDRKDLEELMQNAIQHDALLKTKNISLKETDALLRYSGGDARKVLNGLELVINSVANDAEIVITNDLVQKCIHQNMARYDKTGEQHYDIISAFIKSIRGSDPNAAVYWLARMIAGGEDLKFIARRLLILASEDIGNANPNALMLANNAFQAVTTIGYPEARIILSQCAVYLANSPKSNSTYHAINQALALVEETGDLPVPLHLRN
ncbi:replication-associated recombination protein A, partial [Ornithobacterium rhinotracheale]